MHDYRVTPDLPNLHYHQFRQLHQWIFILLTSTKTALFQKSPLILDFIIINLLMSEDSFGSSAIAEYSSTIFPTSTNVDALRKIHATIYNWFPVRTISVKTVMDLSVNYKVSIFAQFFKNQNPAGNLSTTPPF